MRALGVLLLAGLATAISTAASAQVAFTYDANSPGCYSEYQGKCVKAKLQDCRGKYESYRTAGCRDLSRLEHRLACQNEVDRVRRNCAARTCEFAHECTLDIIGGRRCARMPRTPSRYPGCR
jgi:hypothetical protein